MPLPCVSAAFVAKSLPRPCASTAFVAEAVPLPRASTAFVAKTLRSTIACSPRSNCQRLLRRLRATVAGLLPGSTTDGAPLLQLTVDSTTEVPGPEDR